MAVTFLELYGDRLDRELGSADRSSLFTLARRKAAINEAERWFISETGCLVKTAAITLTDGTAEYDLEDEIDDEFFLRLDPDGPEVESDPDGTGNHNVFYAGDTFRRRTIAWLNRYEPGWRTQTTGTPYCWYETSESGKDLIGLVPAPKVTAPATLTLNVPYTILGQAMVADGDEPFSVGTSPRNPKRTLQTWAKALVLYAASELEKLRKNDTRVLQLLQLAEQQVLDYEAAKTTPGGQTVQVHRSYRRESRGRRWATDYGPFYDPMK